MTPYQFNPDKHYLSSIVLEVDFFNKKNTTQDPFNSDEMAKEFTNMKLSHMAIANL